MRTRTEILAALGVDGGSGRSLPEQLCVACTTTLGLDGAGIALMTDAGHQGVLGTYGEVATRLEDLQYELGEGPSVDASRRNGPALHAELTAGEMSLWPGFGPAAWAAGVRAVFALPLQVGAVRLGSLCLYRSTAGHLDEDGTATALAYADAALAVLLFLHAQVSPGSALHPTLREPLDYRAEVHQATGFLSVQASVGLTEALLLLRAHAFASDRSLVEVARDVLAGRTRIPFVSTEREDD
ncbi:GAF and ANTAR domain-containing protein [Nocardioides antri]|uniref:GAF and ANTAR domain-containing protein n=1 Tax=Nocardioides antri TaxID=2607659 RepID=A0A5B1M445_9ACTN|nr:GAF and ANTAR domain-containing protein [Nocardioides antri]KAA1427521.1 GAF and ANTAR domain-containing protein [Nocardioides antri]